MSYTPPAETGCPRFSRKPRPPLALLDSLPNAPSPASLGPRIPLPGTVSLQDLPSEALFHVKRSPSQLRLTLAAPMLGAFAPPFAPRRWGLSRTDVEVFARRCWGLSRTDAGGFRAPTLGAFAHRRRGLSRPPFAHRRWGISHAEAGGFAPPLRAPHPSGSLRLWALAAPPSDLARLAPHSSVLLRGRRGP